MKFYFIASLWICLTPFSAIAEIPMPFRSNANLLSAESIVLCSEIEEINASRVSQFLSELDQNVASLEVLDGPNPRAKASGFSALVVITGTKIQDATEQCANGTVPYGSEIISEIKATVQDLLEGFEHPDPTLNAALGEVKWSSSNYYHEEENWVTVIIAMRDPSAHDLDFTMIRLFDLPEATCEQNSACLAR
ncbi:hypothetical protein ABLO27_07000 [Roseibium sp. SCPC15]|uniref:hypothetical protein n=1 Tax=Roseibium sp. SCP15 TaxID=3141376 RepID=UPI003337BFBC